MRTTSIALLICMLAFSASATDHGKPISLADATANAVKLSKITVPGGTPFHLKAVVGQPGQSNSDYKADIEEYWIAPDKWRRTVKTPAFSQTLIVNGDSVFEQDAGDYYPFWLRNLVTAVFDLLPDNFTPKSNMQLGWPETPGRSEMIGGMNTVHSSSCSRWDDKVGTPPAQNSVFNTICFAGEEKLLKALFTPYFHAEFQDYKEFKHKQVARLIAESPEPGVRIEARITELGELHKPEESLFSIQQPKPDQERIHSVRLRDEDGRKLVLNGQEIEWSPVHDGRSSGVLSMMVYVDKDGRVRETWPLNADNPFPLAQARKEVSKWRFKPQEREGVAVQMEMLLTFPFQTTIVDPVPLFSDAEARKMTISKSDPKFLQTKFPKGTEFVIRATVDEQGHVVGVENSNHVDTGLFGGAESALRMWLFKPYKLNGKPQRFSADIKFYVR